MRNNLSKAHTNELSQALFFKNKAKRVKKWISDVNKTFEIEKRLNPNSVNGLMRSESCVKKTMCCVLNRKRERNGESLSICCQSDY